MKKGCRNYHLSFGVPTSFAFRYHKAVLALAVLIWMGIIFGAFAYSYMVSSDVDAAESLQEFFKPTIFSEWGIHAILTDSFWWFVMMALLYLFGLCAFGWPLIAFELLVIGFRLGIDQCLWYRYHGWAALLCVACLPSLFYVITVVGMSYECMALSLQISRGVVAHRARPITVRKEFTYCSLWLLIGAVLIFVCAAARTGLPILLGL